MNIFVDKCDAIDKSTAPHLRQTCRTQNFEQNTSRLAERNCNSRGLMRSGGFTLLEVLIALCVAGLLSAIVVPLYGAIVNRAFTAQAVADIGTLDMRLERYFSNNFDYPDTLDKLAGPELIDPWGQPYRYLKIRDNDEPGLRGRLRKDRNLVPINSDFDLYSVGEDGSSRPPLTARPSRDDIVRAADGSFVGVGEDF